MGIMTNFGERMAKRPAIPLLVVLVVTMASLGIIAINPPSFDMEEGSFMPDNDITNAATAVSEAFSSSTSVMSMIDASDADGNVFTRDVFISVLEYERDLYNMRYISAVDGSQQPYYDIQGGVNVNGFTIMNPITTIASALTSIPINDPSADYDMLIAALENVSDIQIQIASYQVLNSEQGAPLVSMFTTDITFTPIDQTTGTASAKGFLMMTMVLSDVVENNIADGAVGFEKDVLAATDLYKEGGTITSGLMIGVVDLNTMMAEIGNMAMEDLSMLIPIALVLIIVILLLMYRDFVDMLIGIFGLILAIIWTFGISTALGVEMTTIAIAVPILILGLGIDYGLHLVFRYREERSEGHDSAGASGRTVNSVGEALVLATVTTVIAFLSYLTSSMSALADFGVMCAIGIISAFIVMLLLIPSMQSIRDRRSDKKGKPSTELKRYRKSKSQSGDIIGKVAGIGGRISAKSPWAVLGVTCIAVLGLGYSATNLSYEFDMYDFIPEGTEASDTLNYLNDNYSTTTNTANIMIYGDGWQLETLWAMEESIDNLKAHPVNGLSYLNGKNDIMI